MAHAGTSAPARLARAAAWPSLPPRPCYVRVSAPRLEEAEPSPTDEVPATRARYGASAFAPPQLRAAVRDTAPATLVSHHATTTVAVPLARLEEPKHATTPVAERQLEEFCDIALGPSSSVWSAEERSLPASTSENGSEEVARLKGKSFYALKDALKAFIKRGDLDLVVRLLQELPRPTLENLLARWRYESFLDAVGKSQRAKPALLFLRLAAPLVRRPVVLAMRVLAACAQCRDLDAGMSVIEVARKHGVAVDAQMLTTLIKVCKAVGNVEKAYRVYLDMRAARLPMDGHVYGALIATCAEAMKRDITVVHERKDQYVLLERAFQYVADAEAAGVALRGPVWNALMVCAGRSGELNRAFEVLHMMQSRGVPADAYTYCALIESCVVTRTPDKALRVFEVAMARGFTSTVQLYTAALSACSLPFPGNWDRALAIYAALQRAAVRPDKKFFACLIAVAGRCGRLDTAFELLTEMAAEGVRPSGTTVSALLHACLGAGNLPLARRVYDACARQGVYPVPSQFNRLMDVYASESRFGEVVSLLTDMVAAGRAPNLNTYRVIINAAERTDQAGLAFQVFALMHANKVLILQNKFAQTIYYALVKACFNQTRFLWAPPGGYPPAGPLQQRAGAATSSGGSSGAGGAAAPHPPHHALLGGALPADRRAEAERVLAALGGHKLRRGPHQSNPFDGPPDSIDWASHALSAFHHMLSRGHRPPMELLDVLLGCMRAKMLPQPTHEADDMGPGGGGGGGGPGAVPGPAAAAFMHPFIPLRSRHEVFEVAFEPRAFAVVEEAIARSLLPRYDPDAPLVMDMRSVPPVVAEAYVLHMLQLLERRARKRAAEVEGDAAPGGGGGGSGGSYHHSITLLVPPFDPDLVKWPSYVTRATMKYTATMSREERAKLRRRNQARRARARRREARLAAAAAAAEAAGGAAGASLNGHATAGPSAAAAAALLRKQQQQRERRGREEDEEDDEDEAAAAAPAGGAPGRAAAAGGRAQEEEDEDEDEEALADGSGAERRLRLGGTAVSSYDELEAAMSDTESDSDPWASEDEAAAAGGAAGVEGDEGGRYTADCTTSLAVAATFQRMKVWMDMDYANGVITVFAVELARWLKRRRQAAEEAAADRAPAGTPPASAAAAAAAAASAGGHHAPPGGEQQHVLHGDGARVAAAAAAAGGALGVGGIAGAMASARLMRGHLGRTPSTQLNPVEVQQRNIRLGMGMGMGMGMGTPVGGAAAGGGGARPSLFGPGPQQQQQQQQQGWQQQPGGQQQQQHSQQHQHQPLFQHHPPPHFAAAAAAAQQQAARGPGATIPSAEGPDAASVAAAASQRGPRQAAVSPSPRGAPRPGGSAAPPSALGGRAAAGSGGGSDAAAASSSAALDSLAARMPSPSRAAAADAALNRPSARRVRTDALPAAAPSAQAQHAHGDNGAANGVNGVNGLHAAAAQYSDAVVVGQNGAAGAGARAPAHQRRPSGPDAVHIAVQPHVEVSLSAGTPVHIGSAAPLLAGDAAAAAAAAAGAAAPAAVSGS